ncbi:hypothetical protein OG225_42845 (plasmid) [Nocardia sp. NBC_01377]|uniref:hypothetical protein n=1 Tax=Nocardia sp. NBC_01377 TaxID=2903595 RepID=UPI002F911F8D
MVTACTTLHRLAAILGAIVVAGVVLAGLSTAQPAPTPPPSSSPSTSAVPVPGTTSTPTPPAPGVSTTTPAPPTSSAPGVQDDACKGHVRIPGIDVCTPIPDGVTSAVTDASKAFLSDIVDAVLNGFIWITKYIWQLFISVDVDMSNSTSTVQKINDMTGELQVIAAGLGFLVALMQMLVHRMMLTGDDAAPEAFAGFLRWALAATLAAPTLLSLSAASDALAQWIFTTAAGPEGPTHVIDTLTSALGGRDERLKTEDVISLALCLLGLIAYVELAIQLFLQKAWMIYVAIALPIAGAASVTGAGKSVFSAMLRLGVTVLLFKPIAALLFAVGFWQIRELDSGADVVTAVLVMVAPAFCMPVLVNLIGNTSVGFAGTPMLRGISQIVRPTRRWAASRRDEWNAGSRQARESADAADDARRSARASSAPSQNTSLATPPPRTSAQGSRNPSAGGSQSTASGNATNSRNRATASAGAAGANTGTGSGGQTRTASGNRSGQSAASGSSSAGAPTSSPGSGSATTAGSRGRQSGGGSSARTTGSRSSGSGSGSAASAGSRSATASQRAGGRSGTGSSAGSGRTSGDPTPPPPQQRQSRRRAPTRRRGGGPSDTLGRIN